VKPPCSQVRAVLLDWDGTLLNSYEADTRAYLPMLHALGVNWGTPELERWYSPDWHRIYRAAKIPCAKWPDADRLWAQAYRKERPPLLPGARRVVKLLSRTFLLSLVTGGSRRRVRRQLRAFRLTQYFRGCVCSEDAYRKKPHPAPLQLAMKLLRLSPEECIYVGDAPEDIEMARRARVRAVAVRGPFVTTDRVRAARPEVLLASIRDLPRYLRTRA
jgi:HAD superfamily hydrolase (TIGR01509 family)